MLFFSTEKYLAKNKPLYITFVDTEKSFNRVPWFVKWFVSEKASDMNGL